MEIPPEQPLGSLLLRLPFKLNGPAKMPLVHMLPTRGVVAAFLHNSRLDDDGNPKLDEFSYSKFMEYAFTYIEPMYAAWVAVIGDTGHRFEDEGTWQHALAHAVQHQRANQLQHDCLRPVVTFVPLGQQGPTQYEFKVTQLSPQTQHYITQEPNLSALLRPPQLQSLALPVPPPAGPFPPQTSPRPPVPPSSALLPPPRSPAPPPALPSSGRKLTKLPFEEQDEVDSLDFFDQLFPWREGEMAALGDAGDGAQRGLEEFGKEAWEARVNLTKQNLDWIDLWASRIRCPAASGPVSPPDFSDRDESDSGGISDDPDLQRPFPDQVIPDSREEKDYGETSLGQETLESETSDSMEKNSLALNDGRIDGSIRQTFRGSSSALPRPSSQQISTPPENPVTTWPPQKGMEVNSRNPFAPGFANKTTPAPAHPFPTVAPPQDDYVEIPATKSAHYRLSTAIEPNMQLNLLSEPSSNKWFSSSSPAEANISLPPPFPTKRLLPPPSEIKRYRPPPKGLLSMPPNVPSGSVIPPVLATPKRDTLSGMPAQKALSGSLTPMLSANAPIFTESTYQPLSILRTPIPPQTKMTSEQRTDSRGPEPIPDTTSSSSPI